MKREPPWTIYALQCPTCGVVRYVGRTQRTPDERLKDHMQHPLNDDLRRWFTELKERGLKPQAISLATARHYMDAARKESHWIAGFSMTFGKSLINRYGRGDYIHLTAVKHNAVLASRKVRDQQRREKCMARRAARALNPAPPPRRFSLGGDAGTIAYWARKIGVSRERMRQRIDKCLKFDVSISEALTTPAGETMPSFLGVKAWSRVKASEK